MGVLRIMRLTPTHVQRDSVNIYPDNSQFVGRCFQVVSQCLLPNRAQCLCLSCAQTTMCMCVQEKCSMYTVAQIDL